MRESIKSALSVYSEWMSLDILWHRYDVPCFVDLMNVYLSEKSTGLVYAGFVENIRLVWKRIQDVWPNWSKENTACLPQIQGKKKPPFHGGLLIFDNSQFL